MLIPFQRGERAGWENNTREFIPEHQRQLHPPHLCNSGSRTLRVAARRQKTLLNLCCSTHHFTLILAHLPRTPPGKCSPRLCRQRAAERHVKLALSFHAARRDGQKGGNAKANEMSRGRFSAANSPSALWQSYKSWVLPLGGTMGSGTLYSQ